MKSFENITTHTKGENADNDVVNNAERINSREKLPEPVYYIESPDDDTVLVGINVTIDREKMNERDISKISWYDTTRERVMTAKETERKDSYFAFRRIEQEGGGSYYFAPMNLDIYNAKVKQRLAAGGGFANNEDLIKAFLSTTEDEV